MLDTHQEIREAEGALALPRMRQGIEYRDVGFRYADSDGSVLRCVDLEARSGEVVAIVGTSGAGKTTLVNLLPRFYDVTDGAIIIDGVDVRQVTLKSLREQIGLVTQETVLFNDTVRANIAYGLEDVDEARVESAARAAFAHDFILDLPRRYDTVIGERGSRLSGGQRQRIAIARALLKDPPILILDEATSALDAESERLVQDALANLMKGRTTLVIAHRLATVRDADRIVVLDGGEVREVGPPRGAAARTRRALQPAPRAAVRARGPGRMIRSMTGYGAARRPPRRCGPRSPSARLNHRFLEVVCHMPRRLAADRARDPRPRGSPAGPRTDRGHGAGPRGRRRGHAGGGVAAARRGARPRPARRSRPSSASTAA